MMRNCLGPRVLIGVCCVALFSSASQATVLKEITFDEMVRQSAAVVIAKVTATEADESPDGRALTRTILDVQEILAGSAPKTLTYRLPGGVNRRDGSFERIAGAPLLQTGETYLLFLRRGTWRHTPFTSWWRGAFQLVSHEGRQVLVDLNGDSVAAVGDSGITLGARIRQRGPTREGGVGRKGQIMAQGAQSTAAQAPPGSLDQIKADLRVRLSRVPAAASSGAIESSPLFETPRAPVFQKSRVHPTPPSNR